MLKHWQFVLIAVVLTLGGTVGWSQTAQVSGVVMDPAKANISGASVELKNDKTGEVYQTRTNGSGLYVVPSLAPGIYTLKITAPGFGTEVVHGVVVHLSLIHISEPT